jgi:hypothetical protein
MGTRLPSEERRQAIVTAVKGTFGASRMSFDRAL